MSDEDIENLVDNADYNIIVGANKTHADTENEVMVRRQQFGMFSEAFSEFSRNETTLKCQVQRAEALCGRPKNNRFLSKKLPICREIPNDDEIFSNFAEKRQYLRY